MKHMFNQFLKTLTLGALVGAAVCPAGAETIVIDAENSPLILGGTGLDPLNKAGKVYDLRDGAVVCMTNSVGVQRLWCCLVATNGTATLQRGETSGTFDVRGVLIASGEGRLQVKGYETITLGTDTSGGAYYGDAYCDAANLSFVDDAGASRAGTFYIYGGTLKTLPRDPKIVRTWEAGRSCVIPSGSDWSDLDEFVFPDNTVNFYLSETNSLKSGCVVKVPAGRIFGIRPGVQEGTYNPFTYSDNLDLGHATFTIDNPVELQGADSTFHLYTYLHTTCSGVISGPGIVRAGITRTGEADVNIRLTGENTFTGDLKVEGYHTHLYLGEKVLPDRRYELRGQYSHVHFLPPADGGPASVTLRYAYGSWWSSQLHAAEGQTVTVRQAEGQLWAVPVSGDETSVIDFNPAKGPVGVRFYGSPQVFVNGVSVLSGASDAILSQNATEEIFFIPGGNGRVNWGLHTPTVTAPWYRLKGSTTVSNTPSARPIKVLGEGTLTLSAPIGEATPNVLLEPGTALNLTMQAPDWHKTVALWLDPNVSQVYKPGELALQAWIDKIGSAPSFTQNYATGKPYIEGMADRRGEGYEHFMAFNDRCYDYVYASDNPRWDGVSHMVMAHLDTREDGLRFINCLNGRLPLHRGGPENIGVNKWQQESIPNAKLVVMVFGSQRGGGAAIIGTSESAFARTEGAASNPIVNAALGGRKVWVDGVEVDPTTTGLNGGWQIISAEVADLTVDGFGWVKRRGTAKGQQYGEILIFTNAVETLVRRQAERELAQRWNVSTYKYGEEPVLAAAVSGSGQAVISSPAFPVTLSGRYCGTATVAAGTTLLIPEALPWTETDVEATGPAAWFDPTVRETVSTLTDLKESEMKRRPDEVRAIWDRRKGFQGTDGYYLFGMSGRTPAYAPSTRGIGGEMPWIDYNNIYEVTKNDTSSGNVLRFRKWTDSSTGIGSGDNAPVGTKTAFIVQDSCRGGSTPVLDTIYGSDDPKNGVVAQYPKRGNSVTDPMMPAKANANLRTGDVRLNGETVATPTATGFSGQPEVFSFATANDYSFPAIFFGYYGDSEPYDTQAGTIQGEILLYDKYLSSEERANVEQYLVGKWVGYLPAGRTDWRSAVIDGAGTVKAASAAVAPQLAETFGGTLEIEGTTALAVTAAIDAKGVVTGGLIRPQATVVLASDTGRPTLTVTVEPGAMGEFPLVDLKALSPAQDWDVRVKKPTGEDVLGAKVVSSRDGAAVTLKITPVGTLLLFR